MLLFYMNPTLGITRFNLDGHKKAFGSSIRELMYWVIITHKKISL